MSDLEDWLEFAISLTYADDTTTSISADTIEEVKKKLEIDAKNLHAKFTIFDTVFIIKVSFNLRIP